MKIAHLFESNRYDVKEIKRNNIEALEDFSEFYNKSNQLSWTLNPQRLLSKIGSTGKLFGLYLDTELVGTIGLKQDDVSDDAFEIGYIMIDADHRTGQNFMKLYVSLIKHIRRSNLVYATTNVDNTKINNILQATNRFTKIAKIRSTFSDSKLYVWLSTSAGGDFDANKETLINNYGTHVLQLF